MADLPDDVARFIADHVDNFEQLEILLLLRDNPRRDYGAGEVTAELRLGPASAVERLRDMAERGFLAASGDPPRYRFAAAGEVARIISEVARCYAERRVSVITAVFSPRTDPVRSFADAFNLRRK